MGSAEGKESTQDGYVLSPSISFFCFHFLFHELLGNSLGPRNPSGNQSTASPWSQ